ncbi:LamG-like jellyroll fold domain-containing protein [Botrimarina colliarenosi]|nr:LamG-like jellyroll fold domain-containing protein [Botrimarina colliarenosi]
MSKLSLPVMLGAFVVSGVLLPCDDAEGAYTLDRWYQMGDDFLFSGGGNAENASNGALVGSGNSQTGVGGGPATYDSAATNNDTFQPLAAFGATGLPTYAQYGVGGNPAAPVPGAASMNQFGIRFDGIDDYLAAVNLNDPSVAAPGSLVSYSTIDRGMQLWVMPTNLDGVAEYVIDDADQHGFNITTAGAWIAETREDRITTNVPVQPNTWAHVMLVHDSVGLQASVMYVNGLAISSQLPLYDSTSPVNLLVGANAEVDTGETQDPNLQTPPAFFSGLIDEIELFVTDDGALYGQFDYARDNGYFTDVFLPAQSGYGFTLNASTGHNSQQWVAGDIDFDGDFDQTDINTFITGWLSKKDDLPGSGPQVGDYLSLALGDLDLDGDTDASDWVVLRGLAAASTSHLTVPPIASVPKPVTVCPALLGCALTPLRRRRTIR